jgi:hypothetical protein
MPEGVEHSEYVAREVAKVDVRDPLMPEGVEHTMQAVDNGGTDRCVTL